MDHQWRKFGWSGQYWMAHWGNVLCTFDNTRFCWCHTSFDGKGLGSPYGPTRWIFRPTSRFIGHLRRLWVYFTHCWFGWSQRWKPEICDMPASSSTAEIKKKWPLIIASSVQIIILQISQMWELSSYIKVSGEFFNGKFNFAVTVCWLIKTQWYICIHRP